MSNSDKKVTRQCAADFELVASHYKIKDLGEYETAKQCVRDDPINAAISYANNALIIRGGWDGKYKEVTA